MTTTFDMLMKSIKENGEKTDILQYQGKMIEVDYEISQYDLDAIAHPRDLENYIKSTLVKFLVEKMIKENCILFTRIKDDLIGIERFKARIFVTPNSDVNAIRKVLE